MCDFTLEDFEALKRGDDNVGRKFVDLTYLYTIRYLIKRGVDKIEVEDYAQESFILFDDEIKFGNFRYQGCKKLKAYISTIAWRLFLKEKKRLKQITGEVPNILEDEDFFIKKELEEKKKLKKKLILQALREQSDLCQQILWNGIVNKVKNEELMKESLSKNANAFKVKKSECKKKLKKRVLELYKLYKI